ncbi:MAG TPA: FKBP-type peptidyl-prolyl cis-trans isomerase [Ferruginibacter sp.]|mgnify:CR=1 FL=1|nr:FKBP-type peptidyl-prolyl cis-trans isomerase [Ferruginibacter sp.]HRN90980.1 FKBP-type peptidyl-prolyl cis-trans isomerase [Ferruginibacter sp.]HRO05273.1 FKBP-type peptidyl-prolyl cis-trans isomerase [Ferruginibacter sp.]HRO96036.1 FKBP-type peptidyl-prolyl cis-trans isomerase [Ferruginibacter sp.]HRP48631.1 FKBP-type peptidyl-prolyl cis-trans isomerase [Ferruginibacter sp.]
MKAITLSIFTCVALNASAQKAGQVSPAPQMKNAVDSFSYALGMNVAQSVKDQGVHEINLALLSRAFEDVLKGEAGAMTSEQAIQVLQSEMQRQTQARVAAEKSKGIKFLEENKKRQGVIVLPNGLQYEIMEAGNPDGPKPSATDVVKVDYVGTFIDGKEFDGSIKRGQPAEFPVNGVISGWTQILQMMPVGATWKVYIPSDLAYGDRGAGNSIPPGATLIFTITLHEIKPKAE